MSTTSRRADLRDRMIILARQVIEAEGTSALKARDLAKAADCSVGSIYNVFGDMNDLLVAVNGETFLALGAHVTDAVTRAGDSDPTARMITMAEAYLDFATRNPRLWRALFDTELTLDSPDAPDWYMKALDDLFAIIDAPLTEIFPTLPPEAIRIRTRALFSSIHGIVLLGIEQRVSGVGPDHLSEMIRFVLSSVTATR
ncbi:MAG: TetR/AcrR family transcriptional regulator [Pseudomonadota bacterium]